MVSSGSSGSRPWASDGEGRAAARRRTAAPGDDRRRLQIEQRGISLELQDSRGIPVKESVGRHRRMPPSIPSSGRRRSLAWWSSRPTGASVGEWQTPATLSWRRSSVRSPGSSSPKLIPRPRCNESCRWRWRPSTGASMRGSPLSKEGPSRSPASSDEVPASSTGSSRRPEKGPVSTPSKNTRCSRREGSPKSCGGQRSRRGPSPSRGSRASSRSVFLPRRRPWALSISIPRSPTPR